MIGLQPELSDGVISLKKLKIIHSEQLYSMRSDSQLCKKAGLRPDHNIGESYLFIKKVNRLVKNLELHYWGIFKDKTLVGVISLWGLDYENKSGELGYFIGTPFQRKGYMTRAIKLVVNYALSISDIKYVTAYVETSNLKSQSLLEKLGFIKYGESVEEDMSDTFVSMYQYKTDKVIP